MRLKRLCRKSVRAGPVSPSRSSTLRAVQSFRPCRKLTDQLLEGSIMKRILGAYLLVIGALSMVSIAQAEEREGSGACRADVQKLCKEVQPGGGRMAACLKQHESAISPGCRERMAEARKEGKDVAEACKADSEALCKARGHRGSALQGRNEPRDTRRGQLHRPFCARGQIGRASCRERV